MDSKQTREIQGKLFELIIYFDSFCKKHKIVYYLSGGSAIGALRHNNFIPWDDDFDVVMDQENYDKFLKTARIRLDISKFYLQEGNTDEWPLSFTKLRMNQTTYIEKDTRNRKMHKGFFIDIFCLYNLSENIIIRYLQYISARILITRALFEKGYDTINSVKKSSIFLSKLIIRKSVKKALTSFIESKKDEPTRYVGNLFTRGSFRTLCYPRDWWGKPIYVRFGKIRLPVGEQVEKYLTLVYGDFMKIPDNKTRREYPSHVLYYNTEVDYREYNHEEKFK